MKSFRLKKLKLGEKTKVEYESVKEDGIDEFSVCLKQNPAPELIRSVESLLPFFIKICELSESWKEKLTIIGVSISYTNAGGSTVRGIVITSKAKLMTTNSPLILNSPHLPEESYSGEEGSGPTWLSGMDKIIDRIEEESLAFVEGKNDQPSLFQGQ